MQFLGPALNGIKACGCLLATSSGEKRSGLNFNGSCQYLGSLWNLCRQTATETPGGTVISPGNVEIVVVF